MSGKTGNIFDIQRWSLHDGPGIRTIVFLKGCPLRCQWCSNPESQERYAEIGYFKDKCILCGYCQSACPYNAIDIQDSQLSINYQICRENCYAKKLSTFPCNEKCYSGALKTFGQGMTVDEVYDRVSRDIKIYHSSGGGITLSGGEPLLQWEFAAELLAKCQKNEINTAIETSGYATWESISSLLPKLDTVLYDIKHIDHNKHLYHIGYGNELILENAKKIAANQKQNGFKMVIRVPIIPDFNSSEDDMRQIAVFVKENLIDVDLIELLPYHRLGRNKYTCLGREYALYNVKPLPDEHIDVLREVIKQYGFKTQSDV